MKAGRNYYDDLIEDLKNPKEAAAYLNAALEAGDKKAFLLALRNVLEACGGMTKVSRHARLNRVSLYKILSKDGNPELNSIIALLDVAGIRLQMVPKSPGKTHQKAA